jgi:hypothetical protein
MQYLLLIYDHEARLAELGEADRAVMMTAYRDVTDRMRASGQMLGGDALDRSTTAKTVRRRDGERTVTDGPFAETREQLGGYYLLETDTLEQALAWAEQIPTAEHGAIEVRPIWSM